MVLEPDEFELALREMREDGKETPVQCMRRLLEEVGQDGIDHKLANMSAHA